MSCVPLLLIVKGEARFAVVKLQPSEPELVVDATVWIDSPVYPEDRTSNSRSEPELVSHQSNSTALTSAPDGSCGTATKIPEPFAFVG